MSNALVLELEVIVTDLPFWKLISGSLQEESILLTFSPAFLNPLSQFTKHGSCVHTHVCLRLSVCLSIYKTCF